MLCRDIITLYSEKHETPVDTLWVKRRAFNVEEDGAYCKRCALEA
jgi:hypothetical protein